MLASSLRRAPAAVLALAVAVAVPVVTSHPEQASAKPRPVRTDSTSHRMHSLSTVEAKRLGGRSAAQTEAVPLDGPVHVVGVTWDGKDVRANDEVQIREQRDGSWGEWTTMDADAGHGPDPGSEEAEAARPGTDAWVTTADAVQTRVVTDGHTLTEAPQLEVVDPGESPADAPVADGPGAAEARGTRPSIYTRAQWGADESIRTHHNTYGEVRAAVIHHTAGSNNYSASEVPAIIRGIYRFHTIDRGWGDIGYNFLIDKFGRTWEGRYGGIDKPIVGAHALGVNSQTYGASIIGNFETTAPSTASLTAEAKLAAWKLGISYVDPTAKTTLDGYGTFSTINGHRDTFGTECPGQKVYDKLPWIRSQAKLYQGAMFYGPSLSSSSVAYGSGGVSVSARAGTDLSWKLTVRSPCRSRAVAVVRGSTSAGAFSAAWNGRITDGSMVPPGDYTVQLTAANGSGVLGAARPITYHVTVRSAAGAPPGFCPPRLTAGNRYAFSVAAARRVSGSTRIVLVNGMENGLPLALVAGPLARAQGAVLLSTNADYLPTDTKNEIVRRGVTDVTVVGGPAWVSDGVVGQIERLGVPADHIERITGGSRYEVGANVARAIADGGQVPDAIVVSGPHESGAWLALAGPASDLRRPILLTGSDFLPAATRDVMAELGVRRTVVAGGPRIVTDDVVAGLPHPTRLQASNRYGISVAVANWARDAGVTVSRVFVGSGNADVAPNTIAAGQKGWVELYVARTGVPGQVADWLDANSTLTRADIVGGTRGVTLVTGGTVQQAVRN